MSLFTRLASLKRNLFRRKRAEADLDAELRSYADLLTDENRAKGLAPDEARRKAQIEFGGIEQVKEHVRDVRVGHYIEMFFRDLRLAFRNIRKYPGFTLIVVLSLALGIGANAAIFSLCRRDHFSPLPGSPSPATSSSSTPPPPNSRATAANSYLDYLDFVARAKSFYSLCVDQGIVGRHEYLCAGAGSKPENVAGLHRLRQLFFHASDRSDRRPRFPSEEGSVPEKFPVAIISYSLWNRVFAKDPAIAGKNVKLNGHRFTIVGSRSPIVHRRRSFLSPRHFRSRRHGAEVTSDGADILKQRTYRAFEHASAASIPASPLRKPKPK